MLQVPWPWPWVLYCTSDMIWYLITLYSTRRTSTGWTSQLTVAEAHVLNGPSDLMAGAAGHVCFSRPWSVRSIHRGCTICALSLMIRLNVFYHLSIIPNDLLQAIIHGAFWFSKPPYHIIRSYHHTYHHTIAPSCSPWSTINNLFPLSSLVSTVFNPPTTCIWLMRRGMDNRATH